MSISPHQYQYQHTVPVSVSGVLSIQYQYSTVPVCSIQYQQSRLKVSNITVVIAPTQQSNRNCLRNMFANDRISTRSFPLGDFATPLFWMDGASTPRGHSIHLHRVVRFEFCGNQLRLTCRTSLCNKFVFLLVKVSVFPFVAGHKLRKWSHTAMMHVLHRAHSLGCGHSS